MPPSKSLLLKIAVMGLLVSPLPETIAAINIPSQHTIVCCTDCGQNKENDGLPSLDFSAGNTKGMGVASLKSSTSVPNAAYFLPSSLGVTTSSGLAGGVKTGSSAEGTNVEYQASCRIASVTIPAGANPDDYQLSCESDEITKQDIIVPMGRMSLNGGSSGSTAVIAIRRPDGTTARYLESTGELYSFTTASGKTTVLSEGQNSIQLEILKENDMLRQVRTASGLADVQLLANEGEGYVVRYYPAAQVGAKGTDGFYTVSGTPTRSLRVENPQWAEERYDQVRIVETIGSREKVNKYSYNESNREWTHTLPDGTRLVRRDSSIQTGVPPVVAGLPAPSTTSLKYIERTKERYDALGSKIGATKYIIWLNKHDEENVLQEIKDYGGLNVATTYAYHMDEGNTATYGRLKSRLSSDGSWEFYAYDSEGRVAKVYGPWLDTPMPGGVPTTDTGFRVREYNYTAVVPGDVLVTRDQRARTVVEKINGIETGRNYYGYPALSNGEAQEVEEQASVQGADLGYTGNLRVTTTYFSAEADEASAGKVKSVQNSDNTLTTYSYTLNPNSADAYLTTTETQGTVSAPAGVAFKSTRTIRVENVEEEEVREETQVYIGGGYSTLTVRENVYDEEGRTIQRKQDGRVLYDAEYANGLLVREVDETGIEAVYTYDVMENLASSVSRGITTTYNRTLGGLDCGCDGSLETTESAGGLTRTRSVLKDKLGRTVQEIDEAGLVTTYAYTNGGRTVTVLHPNTATEIRESYLDGQMKSVTGSGVISQHYTYGVDAGGTQWSKVNQVSANSPRWTKSTIDFLGRSWKTEQPGVGSGAAVTSFSTYDSLGRMASQTTMTTGGSASTTPRTVTYMYDVLRNVTATSTAFSGTTPTIQYSEQKYIQENGKWFVQSKQRVGYQENGASKIVTTGLTKRQVGGFAGNVIAYSESFAGPFDGNGDSVNQTVQSTTLNRSTRTVVSTALYPTSEQPAIQTTVGGLLVSSVLPTHGGTTLYQYDALGRRTGQKEARHTNYATVTYNAQGQVATVTDAAGNTTTYTYYGNGTVGAGQLHQETNALSQTTFHQYDLLGREVYTWGSATYPVAQGYDAYGQRNLLRTFRDTNANFAGGNFPTGANGDTTTWTYDAATGVLLQKTYADGKGPTYDYFADGALKTRTWARQDENNNPLATAYTYTAKGELAQVDYSDATPDVSYTYNALGQQTSITDGAGTRTFSYDAASLNRVAENFAGTLNGTLHRAYDAYNRPTGYALANTAGDDVLTAATYGYDNRGRFAQVHGDTVPAGVPSIAHSLSPLSFSYARLANSDLINTVTGPAHSVTNTYESNRDVLLSKQNATLSNSIVSQFDYSVNPIGQRTSRTQTGAAFTVSSTDNFNYNSRGEVINSTNNINPALDRAYAYDPIGNRLTATEGTEAKSYTANGLNQYLSVTSASSVVNPSYDADGNMLTDGEGKTYTWDGENRLIQVTLPNSEIVRYSYDGQSRRVKREHFSSAATETTTYLYDGWNVIAEWHSPTSGLGLLTSRIWGLDLSYGLQGAGGVGGLLASIAHGSSPIASFPTYDGNGNVSDLLDSEGTVKAHYEYDAFGKETLAVGDWAQENPYRFSTKPWDGTTRLNYYGYRFYQPKDGKWTNRDPMGESFDLNIYLFNRNNAGVFLDFLGLSPMNSSAVPAKKSRPATSDLIGSFAMPVKPINNIKIIDRDLSEATHDYVGSADFDHKLLECTDDGKLKGEIGLAVFGFDATDPAGGIHRRTYHGTVDKDTFQLKVTAEYVEMANLIPALAVSIVGASVPSFFKTRWIARVIGVTGGVGASVAAAQSLTDANRYFATFTVDYEASCECIFTDKDGRKFYGKKVVTDGIKHQLTGDLAVEN